MWLTGSACLVTGAASGIGRATAVALAAAGAEVVGSDRPEAIGAVPGRAIACDLAEDGAPARLAAEAEAALGRVDVLVNCAGVGLYGAAADLEADAVRRLLAVNLAAPVELTRALLPAMLERGSGHVVNVGSVVGFVGRPNEALYAASKAALATFTESLRAEVRPYGVSASLVAPAAVETSFFAERGAPYGRRRPRPVPPERIAAAILGAIRSDRASVVVPRWLALPIRVHALAPRTFRALANRFD